MSLESATYISGLNVNNPTIRDGVSQGDDHLRLIKSTIKTTFPNIDSEVTVDEDSLNQATLLDGKSGTLWATDNLDFKKSGNSVTTFTWDFDANNKKLTVTTTT
jgi:hypothetical protein